MPKLSSSVNEFEEVPVKAPKVAVQKPKITSEDMGKVLQKSMVEA